MNILWMIAFFSVGFLVGGGCDPDNNKAAPHAFVLKSGNSVECEYFSLDGMLCLRCETARDTFSVSCDWSNAPKASNE